jgi:hypothetical protein
MLLHDVNASFLSVISGSIQKFMTYCDISDMLNHKQLNVQLKSAVITGFRRDRGRLALI